jgi:hypothetical protein
MLDLDSFEDVQVAEIENEAGQLEIKSYINETVDTQRRSDEVWSTHFDCLRPFNSTVNRK